jgi:hypothetical protein
MEFVGQEVWGLIEGASLYDKGLPPVAGGFLDQSCYFVAFCRALWAEQAHWSRSER